MTRLAGVLRRPMFALPALVLLTYGCALFGTAVYDDVPNFERNEALRTNDLIAIVSAPFYRDLHYWRPVTSIAMWLGYNFGLFGVHLLALLIHTGATIIAHRIARRVFADSGRALATAALFAVHPLQVESVAWASALSDALCSLWTLLCVEATLRWLAGTSRWPLFASLCACLALLSKETGSIAGLVAIVAGACLMGASFKSRWRVLVGSFVAATAFCLVLRTIMLGGIGSSSGPGVDPIAWVVG